VSIHRSIWLGQLVFECYFFVLLTSSTRVAAIDMPHPSSLKNREGISRPWDRPKTSVKRRKPSTSEINKHSNSSWDDSSTATAPFITIDGVPFFSDRFYLTASEYDFTDLKAKSVLCPSCGSKSSEQEEWDPHFPLFHASRLVASLDLQAAILGTFSLDTEWFLEKFPSLVRIPTLVLYGQRGMDTKPDDKPNWHDNDNDDSSVDSLASEEVFTQPEETLAYAKAMANMEWGDFPPCTLHFTKVVTKWVPPIGGVGTHRAEFKAGVHHPKFMLLWERSGSLIVVVTTANISPRKTSDGVWLQRFYPISTSKKSISQGGAETDGQTSDAGQVLQNLLSAQTHSIQAHSKNMAEVPITPHAFCRKYFGWKNLDPLAYAYDYSTAQVHLVATVPGLYSSPEYGRQRVAHILKCLNSASSDPWLPPHLLTSSDRLIVQPTSFGEWSERGLIRVVQSYLNHDNCKSPDPMLDRLDIVWPTERFIQNVRSTFRTLAPIQCNKRKDQAPPRQSLCTASVRPVRSAQNKGRRPEGMPHERRTNGGYLFLSSSTFNKINPACLSRMVQWKPSHPSRQQPILVSHMKTVARIVGRPGTDGRRNGVNKLQGSEQKMLSWILMTSACLSRGAQGETMEEAASLIHEHKLSDAVSYANFELGVLLCSRVQGKPTDRVYCWKAPRCKCCAKAPQCKCCADSGSRGLASRHSPGPRMIPLPLPFCLDASRYQQDEEELEFCETPYFHEVTPDTACVGNMRITPFGDYVAQKRES